MLEAIIKFGASALVYENVAKDKVQPEISAIPGISVLFMYVANSAEGTSICALIAALFGGISGKLEILVNPPLAEIKGVILIIYPFLSI
jgi:hypothetical protein